MSEGVRGKSMSGEWVVILGFGRAVGKLEGERKGMHT